MNFQLLEKVKRKALDAVGAVGNYFNSGSNQGQNFWSSPVAQGMANVQRTIMPPMQTAGRVLENFQPKITPPITVPEIPNQPVFNTVAKILNLPSTIDNVKAKLLSDMFIKPTGQALTTASSPEKAQTVFKGVADYPTQIKNKDLGAMWDNPATQFALTLPLFMGGGTKAKAGKMVLEKAPSFIDEALKAGKIGLEEANLLRQEYAPVAKTVVENAPKVANLIDKITSDTVAGYAKLKGSDAPGFVSDANGVVQKVKEVGTKKFAELFNPKITETVNRGLQLPAGEIAPPKEITNSTQAANFMKLVNEGKQVIENAIFKAKTPEEFNALVKAGVPQDKIVAPLLEQAAQVKDVGWYEKLILPRLQRLEKSLGPMFQGFKDAIITPHLQNVSDSVDWAKQQFKAVESLGIAPGSKESQLVEKFGTGATTYKQMVVEVGQQTADKVVEADKFFRGWYETTRNFINEKRLAVGLPEIPQKENYYRSMRQFSGKATDMFDSLLSGGKTGATSATLSMKQGAKTSYDAVKGVVDYIEHAKAAGFTDTIIPKIDEFTKTLKEAGGNPKVVAYLQDFNDSISGIKNVGGIGKTIENITAPMRRAKVVGNPSSTVAQFFNLAQGIGRHPVAFFKSLGNTSARFAADSSPYLKALTDRVPVSLTEGVGNKAVKTGGIVMQEANNWTARTLWKSFYQEAIGAGKKSREAAQYAEDMIPQLMGDRRLGMQPGMFENAIGRVVGAFTLENQAGINLLIKDIGEKKVGQVVGTLVAWHLANNVSEKVGAGYTPFLDPVQAVMDAAELWTGSERKDTNRVKAVGRIVAEMTKLTPQLQSSIFGVYKLGEGLGALPPAQDIFGSEDPTWQNVGNLYNPLANVNRNVTGNPWIDKPLNVASSFISGVNPVLKATQAGVSMVRGAAESQAGNIMYEMPKDIFNRTRALIFGQSSTPQAQEYFANDFSRPLAGTQNDVYKNLPADQKSAYLKTAEGQNSTAAKFKSATAEPSFVNKLFGVKDSVPPIGFKPTTAKDKTLLDTYVKTTLDGGQIPSAEYMKDSIFDGRDYASAKTATDKKSVMDAALKAVDNEYYTPEQKDAIISSAGVDKQQLNYYQQASVLEDDRIKLVSDYAGTATHAELMQVLGAGKMEVAGKAITSTGMISYLYDAGYISKDDKSYLSALKWDPVFDKFYMARDYKGGGGGQTAAQRKAVITKLNALFKLGTGTTKPVNTKLKTATIFKTVTPTANSTSKLKITPTKKSGDWFSG